MKTDLVSVDERGRGVRGRVRIIKHRAGTGEVIEEGPWQDNLIMQGSYTGIGLLLANLANDYTYNAAISWIAIGTSGTAPAITDTVLGAEVARAPATNQQVSVGAGTVTIQGFIADAQLSNGTYLEVGSFVGGSSSVNTGQIFNHILLGSPYVKGSGQDTTIQVQFTL